MRLQYDRTQHLYYCEPALRTVSRRLPPSACFLVAGIEWPGSTNFNDLLHVTLPLKNVSLAGWFNSDKEDGNDENIKGALHARSIAAVARMLGVVDQTLFNWVKAHRQGKLTGADSEAPVSAEQMEISRLRAELARVKLERDILGKATAYFARGSI
jgi:transposase